MKKQQKFMIISLGILCTIAGSKEVFRGFTPTLSNRWRFKGFAWETKPNPNNVTTPNLQGNDQVLVLNLTLRI